jgi:hypothetical protein
MKLKVKNFRIKAPPAGAAAGVSFNFLPPTFP